MLSVNSALFIHLAIFLIVVIAVGPLLVKPTMALLEERDERIRGAKEKARSLKEEIGQKTTEMEERLAAAKKSALKERDELRLVNSKKADELTAKARQESMDRLVGMRQRIVGEREAARGALRADVQSLAKELAQRILGRNVA